jgi:hypothetical protein
MKTNLCFGVVWFLSAARYVILMCLCIRKCSTIFSLHECQTIHAIKPEKNGDLVIIFVVNVETGGRLRKHSSIHLATRSLFVQASFVNHLGLFNHSSNAYNFSRIKIWAED